MKRTIAAAVLGTLLLSGCTKQTDVPEPTAEETAKVNPQSEALAQAEQAGLLQSSGDKSLSEQEARDQVADVLDAEDYAVEQTEETLTVGADEDARDYFVFEVIARAENRTVGKVAVDCETGEKYHYLGDGVLEDYSTFPLYDEAADSRAAGKRDQLCVQLFRRYRRHGGGYRRYGQVGRRGAEFPAGGADRDGRGRRPDR